MNYLNDKVFLSKLDNLQKRVQYTKLFLLNYDETPIKEIIGTITNGNLNINGSSAVRRTINLTCQVPLSDIIDNDELLNKKIKIFIGYDNDVLGYEEYGSIVWFPCGVFIISNVSIAKNLDNQTLNIQGRDKMALLDGTIGGKLPATTYFHEIYKTAYDQEGHEITITTHPTIYQIIQEVVHHFGGELAGNILINDLSETAKLLVKYVGENTIYFTADYNSFLFSEPKELDNYIPCKPGQDIGYKLTPMTYPGELVVSAGETIVSVLNKICNILGNFEFYYDIYGRFIFQRKRTYLNDYETINEITPQNYLPYIYNIKGVYQINDLSTITGINYNPKYDNIKNDYLVWGKKESPNGIETLIRYHIAIDSKPMINLAKNNLYQQYSITENANISDTQKFYDFFFHQRDMRNALIVLEKKQDDSWEFQGETIKDLSSVGLSLSSNKSVTSLIVINFKQPYIIKNGELILEKSHLFYNFIEEVQKADNQEIVFKSDENKQWVFNGLTIADLTSIGIQVLEKNSPVTIKKDNFRYKHKMAENYLLISKGSDSSDWREELYRLALENQIDQDEYSYYYPEILAEWRKIYDPIIFPNGWNPIVTQSPSDLTYWFDFIDTPKLDKYSVKNIGRRLEVLNSEAKTIVNLIPPDVIFVRPNENFSEQTDQHYFTLTENFYNLFVASATQASAFDYIRDLLYQHLNYNTQISLTGLPKYFLEPNNVLQLQDTSLGEVKNYIINSISLPLTHSGMMTINGIELFNKI